MTDYAQVTVDLLDLELVVRAFDNACRELDRLAEARPELRIEKPYPYERAVRERLAAVIAEKW